MSEIQESYALLMQIDKLLADIELKITNIQQQAPRVEQTMLTVRETLRLSTRLMHLFAHMGFPPNIQQAINVLNQFIFTARAAYVAMIMLQSGTVYGQIMGVVGIATVAVSVGGGRMLEGY